MAATLTLAPPLECDSCKERPRMSYDDDYCIDCRIQALGDDAYAAEATLRVLRAAFKEALAHIAAADLHKCLEEVVRETGRDGAPTVAVLLAQRKALCDRWDIERESAAQGDIR